MGLNRRPDGLLLDFGGVIVETRKRPTGPREVAVHLHRMLARGGHELDAAALERTFLAGQQALKHWKHASSRRPAPREMSHREVVGEFLLADLPDGARELVIAEASELLATVSVTMSDHVVRPGIPELLAFCRAEGIGVGIVSNAHAGRSHRRILAQHRLDALVDVQVYSDEVGVRKPNPRMIEIAADALGLDPRRTWYVGDTMDRDVAAGRRAGVGAVLLTRSKHTDHPPFDIADSPDVILDDPRGLLDALRAAARGPALASVAPREEGRPALLIDHGGVISSTVPTPAAIEDLARDIARRLGRIHDDAPTAEALLRAMAGAREQHRSAKRELAARYRAGRIDDLPEQTAQQFWARVDALLGGRHTSWLLAEADDLMARYAQAKTVRSLRPGVADLFRACRSAGMAVVVVSNTVSGRTVRAECARHGLADLVAAYVCSDEIGVRKPSPAIFREALAIAQADPHRTWFLGDKPLNDAEGARAVGIAHRVLVRGGSTADEDLDRALTDGSATRVVDSPAHLIDLIDRIAPAI